MPIQGSFGAGSAKSFGFTGGGLPPGIVANGGTLSYDGDYGINFFAASIVNPLRNSELISLPFPV